MEDGVGRFSSLSISELISILRTSFRMSVFDKVEKVLVSREKNLKKELKRKEKECEFLRKKMHASSLEEENVKHYELEHAKRRVEGESGKGGDPRASLLKEYFMSDMDNTLIKKLEASSERLGVGVGVGARIGEGEGPEKCENEKSNSAERRNEGKRTDSGKKEHIAGAESLCKRAASSRTSKVHHAINLRKKPGAKMKRSSDAKSFNKIVIDEDDAINKSSKSSKKPRESNMVPYGIPLEASSGGLNECKKMNTSTEKGETSSKVCEEHSLLKPIPQIFLDIDEEDDDSLDDSSSSDPDDEIHPLFRNLK